MMSGWLNEMIPPIMPSVSQVEGLFMPFDRFFNSGGQSFLEDFFPDMAAGTRPQRVSNNSGDDLLAAIEASRRLQDDGSTSDISTDNTSDAITAGDPPSIYNQEYKPRFPPFENATIRIDPESMEELRLSFNFSRSYPSSVNSQRFFLPHQSPREFKCGTVPPLAESPTFSTRSETASPQSRATQADDEDLEVELINQSREHIRVPAEDENIDSFLYAHSNSSQGTTCSEAGSSNATPAEQRARPPYAKKLSASSQKNSVDLTASVATPVFISPPLFLQTNFEPSHFTPLLTPNSNALLKRNLRNDRTRGNMENDSQLATTGFIAENALFAPPTAGFEHFLNPTSFQQAAHSSYVSPPVYNQPNAGSSSFLNIRSPTLFEEEDPRDKQFSELALEVIEKILLGETNEKNEPSRDFHSITGPEDMFGALELPSSPEEDRIHAEKSQKQKVSVDILLSDSPLPLSPSPTEEDSWETADVDDLTKRMEENLHMAKTTPKKLSVPIPEPAPMPSNWDNQRFSHVLEAYNIPDYIMQQDISNALQMLNLGHSEVKWISRKIVFVVFQNTTLATQALTKINHSWLRLRNLGQSTKHVQIAAIENRMDMNYPIRRVRPITNASVARRTIEHCLGKKSNVSAEKREMEKKQLAEAKAQRKNAPKKSSWD
ncbi:unnamed protein product [Caenorhabditis auriculariae]|uniref:Uncharacterized protein n=1 Tax=Caenorhabditis auriculariae TaxID=2777116 RepID=A0A8S1GRS9_9PELO|nr:unnamed protein product [Caenorhabditis auriculariae]